MKYEKQEFLLYSPLNQGLKLVSIIYSHRN